MAQIDLTCLTFFAVEWQAARLHCFSMICTALIQMRNAGQALHVDNPDQSGLYWFVDNACPLHVTTNGCYCTPGCCAWCAMHPMVILNFAAQHSAHTLSERSFHSAHFTCSSSRARVSCMCLEHCTLNKKVATESRSACSKVACTIACKHAYNATAGYGYGYT